MVASFSDLGLSEATLKAISELGYEEPTPVQEQTIRLMLEGDDVIAQAQTGTGKTAAFALPILQNVDSYLHTPQALILTPTRELAIQVAEAIQSYSKFQKVSVLPVYGGQPIERQLRALQRGVQVVVGTPGRIMDHMRRRTLNLESVKVVVLDEADEMLNMGFIEDIEIILKETSSERQTALFSATMPAPIANLARRYMRDAKRVTVAAEKRSVPQIRQSFYEVGKRDKFEVLSRILDYEVPTAAIIFCRTKLEVDSLVQRLTARAHAAEALHGDLNQMQRDRVMGRFRSEQVDLLVATDVAARGLDVDHITHVINYDIPLDPEIYVHRIGRTGRAGRTGLAISLVTNREARLWQIIQRSVGKPIQKERMPTLGDVVNRRRERFKETLRETLAEEGLEPFFKMADELSEEFTPRDMAAVAFKLLLGDTPEVTEDRLAEPEPTSPKTSFRERREPRSYKEGKRIRMDSEMTRLKIDVGREEGVRPGDIVGAIANEANISGQAIGAIEIHDHYSMVDVPSKQVAHVLMAMKSASIRNHKINIDIAKPRK
ncbi:MAG: DEAD/DEAH box helicase [Chloroflexi bacterium]|nr:DEAD/DEAH box helicase [Chloroflexota bacterium]MCC6892086.1 DEAD/DEAH box helicase [Anaerolineae bacterium]